MQFKAGHGMPCPYKSETKTADGTLTLRNRRQLLPGSMKLNRPLQIQNQRLAV